MKEKKWLIVTACHAGLLGDPRTHAGSGYTIRNPKRVLCPFSPALPFSCSSELILVYINWDILSLILSMFHFSSIR
jgi:hypothetical protein